MSLEVEIKLRVPGSVPSMRQTIREAGFRLRRRRVLERNVLFDTPDLQLRNAGMMLRLREAGRKRALTWKGRSVPGPYKSREELETEINDVNTMERILAKLGYERTFAYDKFREEYSEPGGQDLLTLDETPIGNFIELEGAPDWIDGTAALLGFEREEYIVASYRKLYLDYCAEHGIAPSDMTIGKTAKKRKR